MKTRWNLLCLVLIAAIWTTSATAAAPEATGIVKTSRGTVTIDRAGQELAAPVGTPVFVGDRVQTGAASYVGITLRDDTLMTAGPGSTLLVTEFRFNADTHRGNLLVSLLKGTFSVVTGLIAKQSPRSVEFKTPTMTLGIRGTEFIVEVSGVTE